MKILMSKLLTNQDRKFLGIIFLLFLLNFILSIGYPTLFSIFTKRISVPAVTVSLDGRPSESRLMLVPLDPPDQAFKYALEDYLNYTLPQTLTGQFLLPFSFFVLGQAETSFYIAHMLPHNILWILAVLSIPLTVKYSKEVPILRRIIYVYFIAALIAGTSAGIWSTLG